MIPPSEVVCPTCRGSLSPAAAGARCPACRREYTFRDGYLDLAPPESAAPRGLGPALMHAPPLARIYERFWRPAFVAAATARRPDPERELEIVRTWLLPARDGVVVDLSAGPGLAGRRLAKTGLFSAVWFLDLSRPMLETCRDLCRADGLDDPLLLRGDVLRLPFADGSLAGVHTGAALHLWPSPADAVREVARVLRPGGVFVASTFVHAKEPGLRRLAEHALERVVSLRVFHLRELEELCADAGLAGFRRHIYGAFVLFTASRTGAVGASTASEGVAR